MRNPIIVGNWKMNNGPEAAHKFLHELQKLVGETIIDIDFAIAAPSLSLVSLMPHDHGEGDSINESFYIPLAAQNVHYEKSGAYTGETSISMLEEYGIEYVIIGHSERREYFNETNETVNLKVKATLAADDIIPIMAFGETEEQFDKGETLKVVKKQLIEGLKGIAKEDIGRIVLAYEPIWAIGTGKTATPEQAQEIIKASRDIIEDLFGQDAAEAIRIQYGGSMKPENIKELMAQPDIDGGLVGGASLDAKSFFELITFDK